MTAKEIIQDIVTPIKNINGTNDKKAVLTKWKSDSTFRMVLDYTYNNSKIYGVKNLPDINSLKFKNGADNYIEILTTILDTDISGNLKNDYISKKLKESNKYNYNLLQLILDRNLRIGVDAKTINSILGAGFIKIFKPMKPRGTYNKNKLPLQYDFKYNGQRLCIEKENGYIYFYSSSGIKFDIPYIKEQAIFLLSEVDNVRLDCEIDGFPSAFGVEDGRYADDSVRLITNGWINSTLASKDKSMVDMDKVSKLRVSVFDMVDLKEAYQLKKEANPEKGKTVGETLVERTVKRNKLFKGLKFPNIENAGYGVLKTNEEVLAVFLDIIAKGGEGIIMKSLSSVYHAGETQEWFKLKNIAVADLRIVGYKVGGARTKNAGMVTSVIVSSSCDKLVVAVGSGLMQEDIDNLDEMAQEAFLGSVVEVTFTNSIKRTNGEHSLFLPRFTGGKEGYTNFEASLRLDKDGEALTLEEVKIAELDCAKNLIKKGKL